MPRLPLLLLLFVAFVLREEIAQAAGPMPPPVLKMSATPVDSLSVARPAPRLKLSVSRFSIDNLDRTPVPLSGLHLDVYPLSERWMRGGFSFAGGTGHASELNSSISMIYGLMGLTAGVQYPGRITPFVEGHISGGFLSGKQDGPITIAGTTISGASGTTWLAGRGVEVGAEVYVSGRVYLSSTFGWMRATWGAPDIVSRVQNPRSDLRLVNITSDSLFWKLGVGI